MLSLPTRRAQEDFEILDELHAEGYVTHEEWMTDEVATLIRTHEVE